METRTRVGACLEGTRLVVGFSAAKTRTSPRTNLARHHKAATARAFLEALAAGAQAFRLETSLHRQVVSSQSPLYSAQRQQVAAAVPQRRLSAVEADSVSDSRRRTTRAQHQPPLGHHYLGAWVRSPLASQRALPKASSRGAVQVVGSSALHRQVQHPLLAREVAVSASATQASHRAPEVTNKIRTKVLKVSSVNLAPQHQSLPPAVSLVALGKDPLHHRQIKPLHCLSRPLDPHRKTACSVTSERRMRINSRVSRPADNSSKESKARLDSA